MFDNSKYLTDMPQEMEVHGLCKTMVVRNEVIHIKHIFTEVFIRKTIDINRLLELINFTLFDYMEYMTQRIRRIHHFNREYVNNINEIVKSDRTHFFPVIELYRGLSNVIVLDFDGVVTKQSFEKLYQLCIERCDNVVICTANPTVTNEFFIRRGLSIPYKIFACKGKTKKLIKLIELQKKYENVFFVDNETEYLDFAWVFGIRTFQFKQNKIIYHTRKTK